MIVVAAIHGGGTAAPTVAGLVDLASDQELVAVCGYPAGAPLLVALRAALPRFEVVAVLADPPTAAELALIELLLEQGALPVVVTAEQRVAEVTGWLAARLDDAVKFAATRPPDAVIAP